MSDLVTSKILKSEKGMAILLALFFMSIMTFIAVELAYDTSVDYAVASNQVNRIRAFYAAKAGVEISLLRINFYKQAIQALGNNPDLAKKLEIIWSFPFAWPPSLAGAKVTEVDKSALKSAVEDSLMKAQYAATISPEGGKIDINDLGSDVKELKKGMIQQIENVFKAEVEHNEEFSDKYRGYNFLELVNNIADYIDEDSESLNGGDESAPYSDFNEPGLTMPPNRPLRTVDELHQVGGMKDDFYNVLAPRVTAFGTKGININYAPKEVLMALDQSMTEEAADRVIARRNSNKAGEGPFKDETDFYNFVQGFGVNTRAMDERKVPLLFGTELNFRVEATGLAGNVKREIIVVTYDFANLTKSLAEKLTKQENPNPSNPPVDPPNKPPGNPPSNPENKPKGRPAVVYWEEN